MSGEPRLGLPNKPALLLCVLAVAVTVSVAADEFGMGARPWFGWWDANVTLGRAYTVVIAHLRPNGAAARAGLKAGDRVDLRQQTLQGRLAILFQPMATRPTVLSVDRARTMRRVTVVGSTVWERATFWKLQPMVSRLIVDACFTLCVVVIALRRRDRQAYLLSLVLVALVGKMLDPSFVVVPVAALALVLLATSRVCATLASCLLVKLSSEVGVPSAWRSSVECCAYGAIVTGLVADGAAISGLLTTRIDPVPYILSLNPGRDYVDLLGSALVALTACIAVMRASRSEQLRAAGLLLPLPIALFVSASLFTAPIFFRSWFATVAVIAAANAAMLLGASIATWTILQRREPSGTLRRRAPIGFVWSSE